MSSNLQNSIDSITGTALVYKDYITGTCFTGSQTLGAGHDLISGKQGADLIAKSLVGGTNVTLSSDDSTITINASAGGGGGGGGGGSCGENGIGPGSMSGIAERSNFAGRLPDVIWGATNNAALRTPLYFTEMDMNAGTPDRVYYRPINYAQSVYIEFNNDANGTHRSTNGAVSGLVDGAGNDFSLQQYVSSGYAAFYNSGCGGGSAGDALPVSGLQNNKFLTGSPNASNFERDLPDAVFASGVSSSAGALYKVPFVGISSNGNSYMYGSQINSNLFCSIDFYTTDVSGTINGTPSNCSTPYASLAEMIDSGAAIYY